MCVELSELANGDIYSLQRGLMLFLTKSSQLHLLLERQPLQQPCLCCSGCSLQVAFRAIHYMVALVVLKEFRPGTLLCGSTLLVWLSNYLCAPGLLLYWRGVLREMGP